MNLLFEDKRQYEINDTIESVHSQLRLLVDSPWHNFTHNLAGTVSDDNSFKIFPKLSFTMNVFGMPSGIAVIAGKLSDNGNKTIVHTVVRAKYSIVISFYFVLFFLIIAVMELSNSYYAESWAKPLTLLLILMFLFGLIRFSTQRLRKRFEKNMYVKASN